MSLFFLANNQGSFGNVNNGLYNSDYVSVFRDPINIPPHAEVTIEKAFVPINSLITIFDSGENQNNIFYMRFRAPPSTSGNMFFPSSTVLGGNLYDPVSLTNAPQYNGLYSPCYLTAGTYDAESFATELQNAINRNFNANIAPNISICRVADATPAIWASTAYIAPDYFASDWVCNCAYDDDLNIIKFSLKIYSDATAIPVFRKLDITFRFDQQVSGGIGTNSLARILGINYNFLQNGTPINNFGILQQDFRIDKNFNDYLSFNSGNIRYNGVDGRGKEYSGAYVIEIQELGTSLYNSEIKSKIPAVGIIPYDIGDIDKRYVYYEPQFPLKLQCANEHQLNLNQLHIQIREVDGSLANTYDAVERTYVVVRIETDNDIEKQLRHEVKREERKKNIEQSMALFKQLNQD